MKNIIIKLATLIFSIPILGSCVMTSTVSEIDDIVGKTENSITTKSDKLKKGTLVLEISNTANNTSLMIDSIQICNIRIEGHSTGEVRTGNQTLPSSNNSLQINYNETIITPGIKVLEQTFTPWNETDHPNNTKKMYVAIYGKLITYITDNKPFTLFEGTMYFTFDGSITANETKQVKFELYNNCPLYCSINGKIEKVLSQIGFSVTVNEWK